METHGYMILVFDTGLGLYKPVSQPWFYSKMVAQQQLDKFEEVNEALPADERLEFRLCAVKG